ncbi:LOW QUALITY PROTEIN: uncharacterized protein LOC135207961 [Macrobrachium nipponense]|uniref:LOW QUALITY PROTEIN: uncharacterized protein LOC135207961 n=1 Tax=Macrobrachium nipponense TaxID=159736 RepID=UPI0030C80B88
MRTLWIVSSQNRSGRSQYTLNWVWLWVWVWSLTLCRVAGECPKVCECKWKDGKRTVSCIGAEFDDIPRRLDPSTQVLDLMQNNLKVLPEHAFANTGLVNLQKLWLTYCNLKQLDRGAFKMLANLVELDLSHNLLRSVPSAALSDIPGLRELRMARNALTSIPAEAFTPTPDLVRLDLSSNRIYALHYHAFWGLASLEVLKLSGNVLNHMGQEVLVPLMALHGLHLNDNPWQCDCRLRPLREWMINNNIAGLVPPTCARPTRISGRGWHTLTLDEFVCVPHVAAIVPEIFAQQGDNVSLACRVESDMKSEVMWLVGDKPLVNATDSWRYKVLELVSLNQSALLSNLTISGAVAKDQGTYRCIAENKAGRAESNVTLQVSADESESGFVFFDTTYMTGGLLSGLGFLITILLLVSCVVHRRQRVRLFRRQEEERGRAALNPPQTAVAGCKPKPPATQQRFSANYQASSDEKEPLHPTHSKHSRSPRDNVNGSYSRSSHARYQENNIDDPRAHHRLSQNNLDRLSYAEVPICDLSRSRSDLEERLSWKNLEFETDILRRECSPTGSVVSVVSNGPYPDMVDIPYTHTGDEYRSEFQAYDSSFSNRPRKSSHHSYEDTRLGHLSYDHSSLDGRCYSDLNLALSEDSYDALSRRIGRRRAIRYPSLPTTPMIEHDEPVRITSAHDARRLRRIMASHRGKYHSLEGTSELSSGDPYRYHFHAARLDKFLQEYRGLQAQIYRRKAAVNRPGSTARLSASDTLDVTGTSLYKDATVPPYMEVDIGLSHRRALPTTKALLSASQSVGMNKGPVLSTERRRSMAQVGNLTHSDSVIEAMQGRALTPTDYMIEVMQNTDVVATPKTIIDAVTTRDLEDSESMREVREAMQEARDLSPAESVMDVMKGRMLRSSESLPVIQRRKRSSTDSRMDSSSEEPPRQTEPLRSILKNRYEGGGLLYSGGQYPQSAYYDSSGVCEGNIDTSYSSEYKDYLDHES